MDKELTFEDMCTINTKPVDKTMTLDMWFRKRREKELLDTPKENITHEMIFDLWFNGSTGNWFKIVAYNNGKYFTSYQNTSWMNKEELLKLEYATTPKE